MNIARKWVVSPNAVCVPCDCKGNRLHFHGHAHEVNAEWVRS